MGGGGSKEKETGHADYDRLGAVIVEEIDDPQGGDKISFMNFTRSVESEKSYKDWLVDIQRIDDTESREVLLLPEKHSFEKAGMCGSTGNVHLTYDNFPFVLDIQIKNRKRLGRYFLETEMWYLLYNIVRAGQKFEKIKRKIGDVRPNNILINDDGQIKVLSIVSLPNELDNFQRVVEDKNTIVYLAPEELNGPAISQGQYPSDLDPCRAQVFSIGLTILASGILQDCSSVYEGLRLNQQRLNQLLGIFRQKYSNYLFNTVASMLALKPQQRRRASEIYNELLPYENNILDLEEFTVERTSFPGHQVRPVSQQLPPGVHPYYPPERQTQPMHYSGHSQPGFQFQVQPQQYRR